MSGRSVSRSFVSPSTRNDHRGRGRRRGRDDGGASTGGSATGAARRDAARRSRSGDGCAVSNSTPGRTTIVGIGSGAFRMTAVAAATVAAGVAATLAASSSAGSSTGVATLGNSAGEFRRRDRRGGMSATDGVSLTTTDDRRLSAATASASISTRISRRFRRGRRLRRRRRVSARPLSARGLRRVPPSEPAVAFGAAGVLRRTAPSARSLSLRPAASFAATFGAAARVDARPSFGAFRFFAGAPTFASTSGATGACGSSSGGAAHRRCAPAFDASGDALADFFPRSTGFAPGSAGTSPSIGVRSPEYFELSSRVVCAGCFARARRAF